MVMGRCRTNLDKARGFTWPSTFVAVPRIGEKVRADCGYDLYVHGITYTMDGTAPIVIIELGLPARQTVADYNPKS